MTASRIGDMKTYVTLNELLPNRGLIHKIILHNNDHIWFIERERKPRGYEIFTDKRKEHIQLTQMMY